MDDHEVKEEKIELAKRIFVALVTSDQEGCTWNSLATQSFAAAEEFMKMAWNVV